MKNKMHFLKRIKFGRIIASVLLLLCIFSVYKISLYSVHKTDKISDVSYRVIYNNEEERDVFANPDIYRFSEFDDLKTSFFQTRIKNDALIRVSVNPISENYTYILVNLNRKYSDHIKAYTSDGQEIQPSYPTIISYNPNGDFKYYEIPKSDDSSYFYFHVDSGYKLSSFNNPFFLVGTESELLLTYWAKSIPEILISLALILICLFLFFVFYIIVIDKYMIVRLFSLSFFLVALQSLICSPGVTFTFNEYSNLLATIEVIIYLLIFILTFIMPMVYTINDKIKKFYKYNIIACVVIIFITIANDIAGNYVNILLLDACTVYFIGVSLYSVILNIRDFEDEMERISILRSLSFFSLVCINLIFFMYETRSLLDSSRMPYYFMLLTYTITVIVYIAYVFYYRGKYILDVDTFLNEEKIIIDSINKSGKISISNINMEQILKNTIDDIKMLYPNCEGILVLQKEDRKNVLVIENYEFEIDNHNIEKLFKKYFIRPKSSQFSTYFNSEIATLSLTVSADEQFLILIKSYKNLSNIDEIVSRILASSILTSFNNCTVHDNIYEVEQGFLLAIGTLISKKSGFKNFDHWRVGEYCYILAKKVGMQEDDAKRFKIASYIYDIGKLGLPDEYYNFNSILVSERQIFYSHTTTGYEILSKIKNKTMQTAAVCALNHHEKYNGKGYLGKFGKDIPVLARILSVCEAFEDVYLEISRDKEDLTISEITRECYNRLAIIADTELDADIVQDFINMKKEVDQIIKKSKTRSLSNEK